MICIYNNSKIYIPGKCSLTLDHKKDHSDVMFIVVDSKFVPILGLSTTESLNLINWISIINISSEQFLAKFSDCLDKIRSLNNTHHIEIKDKVMPVLTATGLKPTTT